MRDGSTLFVDLDVHKDSIAAAVARELAAFTWAIARTQAIST